MSRELPLQDDSTGYQVDHDQYTVYKSMIDK